LGDESITHSNGVDYIQCVTSFCIGA